MKNLFLALVFILTSTFTFASNHASSINNNLNEIKEQKESEMFRSCYAVVTETTTNMFGQEVTTTTYHYLGEVANNGFGNIDCVNRVRAFAATAPHLSQL